MWYIHTFLRRCVCVFPKLQRWSLSLGNSSNLGPLFKKPNHGRKCFANQRDFFWSSCMPSHTNYFKTTIHTVNGWISASRFITVVPGARTWSFGLGSTAMLIWTVCLSLAQRGISSFSVKQTGTHLFNTSWWPDCSETQLYRAGRLSGRSCVLAASAAVSEQKEHGLELRPHGNQITSWWFSGIIKHISLKKTHQSCWHSTLFSFTICCLFGLK